MNSDYICTTGPVGKQQNKKPKPSNNSLVSFKPTVPMYRVKTLMPSFHVGSHVLN